MKAPPLPALKWPLDLESRSASSRGWVREGEPDPHVLKSGAGGWGRMELPQLSWSWGSFPKI